MNGNTKRDLLILPVSFAVLLAWIGSLVDSFITASYEALSFTTPLMIALAGYVFGVQLVRRDRNGGDK